MLEWRDEGVVLGIRPHGETAVILEAFTALHGRHLGVVRGGIGRRLRPVLQPGNRVSVAWRARLDDHIGAFAVEPVRSVAHLMSDRTALAALSSVTALLTVALPEREPQPELYAQTAELLSGLGARAWPAAYLRWELLLLQDLGYGLDLGRCAVTGAETDLAYVSPRTGRAVSRAGAGAWAEKLLPLPACLTSDAVGDIADVLAGLRTTGFFLERALAELSDAPLPPARERLADRLRQAAG